MDIFTGYVPFLFRGRGAELDRMTIQNVRLHDRMPRMRQRPGAKSVNFSLSDPFSSEISSSPERFLWKVYRFTTKYQNKVHNGLIMAKISNITIKVVGSI